jgi:creatinine amidohydrolase/Fe(II)-dependent formamide hydrolase-like protein
MFSTHNFSNPEVLKECPSGIFSSLHPKYGTSIEGSALVKRNRLADAHGPPHSHSAGGLPAIQRFASFKEFSASGVIGDARRANADKGERIFAAVAQAIAGAIADAQSWRS